MALVRLESIRLFLPGDRSRRLILRDLDWQIEPGSHFAVTGENGAGKTTLLRLLHGEIWPSGGAIVWQTASGPERSPIIGRKISRLVSPASQAKIQRLGWNGNVHSLLASACESPCSLAKPDLATPDPAASLLTEWGAEPLLEQGLAELSQGQLRLIILARAILAAPPLLLLDEWSDGLDARSRKCVLRELARIAPSTALIFASHRSEDLPEWLNGHFSLRSGRLYSAKGAQSAIPPPPGPVAMPVNPGPELINLHNASVVKDGKTLLDNINWQLRAGEHWRILGPNGAGKSTFLRLLAGDEFVYAGGGMSLRSLRTGSQLCSLPEKRKAISLVSALGDACYGYNLTALELILSGFENSIGLYRSYEQAEKDWARQLLAVFFPDGDELADCPMRMVSTGQLRRLFLARALVCKPEILLLDEPASGLDPDSRSRFLELLTELALGKIAGLKPALVFVSHEAEEPACINRWARIEAGKLFSLANAPD